MRFALLVALLISLTHAVAACVGGGPGGGGGCCKVCRSGKACGDSCIASTATCSVGPGCACNGFASVALVETSDAACLPSP